MPNYYPRRIQPADSLLYDAQGNLVGLRSGTSGDEAIFGLSASELAATQALVSGDANAATGAIGGALSKFSAYAQLSATNTPAQNSAAIADAIASLLLLNRSGGNVIFPNGEFTCGDAITVTGFIPQEAGGWIGGIRFCGAGTFATKLVFTSTKAFIVDPTGTGVGSTAMVGFEDMQIVGPGVGVSGSALLDYSPQTASGTGAMRIRLQNLYLSDAESLVRLDDCTNFYAECVLFQRYVYALNYGYNVDIVTCSQCYFGSSRTVIATRSETALNYNFRSPAHAAGALNQNAHKYIGCWFMRQLVVANFYDSTVGNVNFDTCYVESSKQYALLGNSGTSTGPKCVSWDNCHFSIVYDATDTQAKIQNMNAAGDTTIVLNWCRTDDSNGPNQGWIDSGGSPGMTAYMEGNILTTGGSASVNAHIRYGAKNIVVPTRGSYVFKSATNSGGLVEQFNGSTTTPHRETYASFSAANGAVFAKYGVKTGSSEADASGNPAYIRNNILSGAHYISWDGYSRAPNVASLPTADAIFRGCRALVAGGVGVADLEYVCCKSAADTYSWKLVTTG